MWNAIVIAEMVFTSTICAAILALPFIAKAKYPSIEETENE
ncbi:hypothetical protein [Aneurinibacillus aneurinilyticus]|jgi:hypothetical protein|uniref:Uncharacterized protein n=1 Tax=Aneurinibacillus aneurinilyticus ATCC 12856 TaxID=649747 RepID=U1WXW3_ANEAE|nr:hypothetical protein [Aneurinibacillus aneurinilyticus]ERI07530.1 hypothetical protein HMPREF0083_04402 [Aneurinibacillus aneurinilyticus ATCC 12856]MED0672999.1 hypothetical protein [Aneurinibacillus aneurinilyticus]MED0709531.1 hypothetical protein [Aneurinibacillus aneurinilyticus]MED0726612.1 hypothetical protein [Aneurinibacillus aneurinilyticus]MED0733728.1 hypothetical protein [Aneurinibacillus aneurinilyticus]